MNHWEDGDLYNIVIDWVAERQRAGELSPGWTSVQSFNGDKILAYRHAHPVRRAEPYLVIYTEKKDGGIPRYEAHSYINWKLGFVEIVGRCDAADPKFFETLLNDMIGIQSAEAMDALNNGDDHEC